MFINIINLFDTTKWKEILTKLKLSVTGETNSKSFKHAWSSSLKLLLKSTHTLGGGGSSNPEVLESRISTSLEVDDFLELLLSRAGAFFPTFAQRATPPTLLYSHDNRKLYRVRFTSLWMQNVIPFLILR